MKLPRNMENRRKEIKLRRQRNRDHVKGRKLQAGACASCKRICTSENYQEFHWDHLEPHLKSLPISRMGLHSLDAIDLEIAKCQLLCLDCHVVRTTEERHHAYRKDGMIALYNLDQLELDL